MLNEILFVATLFVIRVVLPVLVTLFLGSVIERKLNHGVRSAS
jgi:hypothetical protein